MPGLRETGVDHVHGMCKLVKSTNTIFVEIFQFILYNINKLTIKTCDILSIFLEINLDRKKQKNKGV